MGATRDNFIKYPRTPHLFGSKGKAVVVIASRVYLAHHPSGPRSKPILN